MKRNMLIVHGGGPTAVMNASLCGAVSAAQGNTAVGRIYAAEGGMQGLMAERFIDCTDLTETDLKKLTGTPGSAIGTSRFPIAETEYALIPDILKRNRIEMVLLNGGNGTMDTCGRISDICAGTGIRVMGIPKTVDNDLAGTDHAPGYGSAARFMAQSTAEIIADVHALPIHVAVVEAMGRNAGWITAASALAEDAGLGGPDLVYLPERDFDPEAYLKDVQDLLKKKKGIVVVCSEGLHSRDGSPVVPPVYRSDRGVYFGDVSAHLAQLITKRLQYKAYSIKPGLLGRASSSTVSVRDREEAFKAGRIAAEAAIHGESGKMVSFVRESGKEYAVRMELTDVHDAMLHERKMPDAFINAEGNGVTESFREWCRPLLGDPLPAFCSLRPDAGNNLSE